MTGRSSNWGGRREGAGIKTDEPMRKVSVTLPESLLARIDKEAYAEGGSSRSAVIARYLRQAMG